MSLLKKLQFGDNAFRKYNKEYLLSDYKCHVTRQHNEFRPRGEKRCERLVLTIVVPNKPEPEIYQWFVNQELLSGRIVIEFPPQANNLGQDSKVLEFDGALCYSIEEEYHIGNTQRRLLRLSLVAEKVVIDEITFNRL